MDGKELRKLIKFCQKNGIVSIKTDGVELQFLQSAVSPKTRRSNKGKVATDQKMTIPSDSPSDEDFLFWSSTPHGLEGRLSAEDNPV